ncbi:MAG TPA: AI-2E family transporter [Thermomicrobiaceae bacterium]|nr:AI-2E family transporter [Thermomicrobiaceae bacterium]
MNRFQLSTRSILLLLVVVLAAWFVIQVWSVLLLLAVSMMLAAAMLPAVGWLAAHRVRRGLAVLIVTVLLLGVMSLIGFVLVPAFIRQAQALIARLPEIRASLTQFLIQHHQTSLARRLENFDIGTVIQPTAIANTGGFLLNVIYSTVTVLALTVYFLLDAHRAESFLFYVLPDDYHAHLRQLIFELRRTVGGYIRGQLITSIMITVYTLIVLEVLGIPNPLAFAVLAGIGDMVPMVGGVIAAAPACIFALTISFPIAVIVSVLLTLYQEFETRFLVPRVYGSTLQLPSVVVFVALLMGAEVAGIIGALLAVPFVAALRGMIEYFHDVRNGRVPPLRPVEGGSSEDDRAPEPEVPAGGPPDAPWSPTPVGGRPGREAVLAAAARTFPAEEPAAVMDVLDRYGAAPRDRERDRVQLAILALSRGSLDRLITYTERACHDYRDVLYWAEYLPGTGHRPGDGAG